MEEQTLFEQIATAEWVLDGRPDDGPQQQTRKGVSRFTKLRRNGDCLQEAGHHDAIVTCAQFRTVSRTMRSSYVSHKSQNVRDFKKTRTLEHHHHSQLWDERNVQEPLDERYSDASSNNADRTAL